MNQNLNRICNRIGFIMQTCDLSFSQDLSQHAVSPSQFHSPTYCAMSLSVRICELYVFEFYIYNYPALIVSISTNHLYHNFVSMFKLSNLSLSLTSAGSWDAMKSLLSKLCSSLILALPLLLESVTYRLKRLSVPVGGDAILMMT